MNLKALALQVLSTKEEIKPTIKKTDFTPKLLKLKKVEKFTPDSSQWINSKRAILRQAGFTDKDLYGHKWVAGVADLKLWKHPRLSATIQKETIFFTWINKTGKQITQTCRPERTSDGTN